MKNWLIIIWILTYTTSQAQEKKFALGIATNFAKYPLGTFGLEAILMKENSKFQGVLNLDYINATLNYKKDRYINNINEAVVSHINDRSLGWGLGGQVNWSLLNKEKERTTDFLIGLGYQYQSINIKFKEGIYVPYSTFYYYKETFFTEPITSHRGQIMALLQVQKPLFVEIGFGIAIRNAHTSETLNMYRNYNKYYIDVAYKGIMPVMSFKIGYLFNR